jgi:glycerol-3-phosphate dehydrogenase (NAD(P)+)
MSALLYGRAESEAFAGLSRTRRNEYLELPDGVELASDLGLALENETVIISVGVQDLRALAKEIAVYGVAGRTFLLAMKGLETESAKTPSQIFKEEAGEGARLAILAGPGHVQDYARGVPSCAVIDSEDAETKASLATALASPLIRFYYGDDFIGNQAGAAMKNVIGIAAGILDGLGWQGLKGGLMVRAPREVGRLIKHYGGNERSAYGLAHLGDYEATLFSAHSHNRMYGEAFARREKFGRLAEGYYTLAAAKRVADREKIDMPIVQALYSAIYEGADIKRSIQSLFEREGKGEFE